MAGQTSIDPFSSKGVLKIGQLPDDFQHAWHGFKLGGMLQSKVLSLADIDEPRIPELKANIFKLQLDEVSLGQLDAEASSYGDSSSIRPEEPNLDGPMSDDDVWDLNVLAGLQQKSGLLTWDRFHERAVCEKAVPYLSEANSNTFDHLSCQLWRAKHESNLDFAQIDQFYSSLSHLVLGRSSLFFVWHNKIRRFVLRTKDFAVAGVSPELTSLICDQFMSCGSSFRRIKDFVQLSDSPFATLHGFRRSLSHVIQAIEVHFPRVMSDTPTILRLSATIDRYSELLAAMECFIGVTGACRDEATLIAKTSKAMDDCWSSYKHLRPIVSEMAVFMLASSLMDTARQLGLCHDQSGATTTNSWLLQELLPHYEAVFDETVDCLAMAKQRQKIPSLVYPVKSSPMKLANTWLALLDLQQTAYDIENHTKSSPDQQAMYLSDSTPHRIDMASSISRDDPFQAHFELMPSHGRDGEVLHSEKAPILDFVLAWLEEGRSDEMPELSPIQAIELSVSPFLSCQHRVASYMVLRQAFLEHNLLAHLDTLHAFQLFGNGLFVTRLSRALFNADQDSAEGRRKTGLSSGLRLEDRETWPPASSELRLVLMELLTNSATDDLPRGSLECISFAIREVSGHDLGLYRNIHSTHALDFLRLVFTLPDSALEAVISPPALEKYDRIFKFLLVLLRMHALSQSMVADTIRRQALKSSPYHHRLCLGLHHFVSVLINFALNAAVRDPWDRFRRHAHEIHHRLLHNDYEGSINAAEGITKLRERLEDTLNEILGALLLKEKQAEAYDSVNDIFTLGLNFASRTTTTDGHVESDSYEQFRASVHAFLGHIRRLQEETQGSGLQRLEILFVNMNFSGYYEPGDGV